MFINMVHSKRVDQYLFSENNAKRFIFLDRNVAITEHIYIFTLKVSGMIKYHYKKLLHESLAWKGWN